jgi:hypothetical protein
MNDSLYSYNSIIDGIFDSSEFCEYLSDAILKVLGPNKITDELKESFKKVSLLELSE